MTIEEKLKLAIDALKAIANCPEGNCEKYVAKVDAIAVEALVRLECAA
jgi:hypothetical protein